MRDVLDEAFCTGTSRAGQWTIGYAYAAVGRLDEAARHAAVLNQMGPDVPYTRQLLALLDVLEQAVDQGF